MERPGQGGGMAGTVPLCLELRWASQGLEGCPMRVPVDHHSFKVPTPSPHPTNTPAGSFPQLGRKDSTKH